MSHSSTLCLVVLTCGSLILALPAADTQTATVARSTDHAAAVLPRYTRAEIIDRVRAAHPGLQASRARHAAVVAQTRALVGELLPRVIARAGYLYQAEQRLDLGFQEVTQEAEDRWEAALRVEQLIWGWGLHGADHDVRDARRLASVADIAATERDLISAAREAHNAWLLADATVIIARQRLDQRADVFSRTERLAAPQAGLASQLDLRQARLDLLDARSDLRSAEQDLVEAELLIARLIGERHGSFHLTATDRLEELTLDAHQEGSPDWQGRDLAAAGPDVRSLEASAEAEEAEARRRRSDRLPILSGFAEAVADGEPGDRESRDETWRAGLTLRWELYDGGVNAARQEAARARMRALAAQREDLIRDRRYRFDRAMSRWQTLQEQLAIVEEAIALAEDNYQTALGNFDQGLLTVTELGEFSLGIWEQRFARAGIRFRQRQVLDVLRELAVP